MKRNKTFIICLLVLLFNHPNVSAINYTKLAQQVSMDAAKQLEKKSNLRCIGSGGGTMDGVECEELFFEIAAPIRIKEARKLVVECSEFFLRTLNTNKELRPYLAEYPFPIARIELGFFVRNYKIYKNSDTLSSFGITFYHRKNQSIVDYTIADDETNLKKILEETYEQAKQLVTQGESITYE